MKKQLGFGEVGLILFVAVFIAVVAFFVGRNSVSSVTSLESTPNPLPAATEGPVLAATSVPTVAPNPLTEVPGDWQDYSGNDFSVKYPSSWSVKPGEYLNSTSILDSNGNFIVVSKGQYPFGTADSIAKVKSEDTTINIGGQNYTAKEKTINNLNTIVNIKLEVPGNYFVFISLHDKANSPETYDTMLKILSTLQFNQ